MVRSPGAFGLFNPAGEGVMVFQWKKKEDLFDMIEFPLLLDGKKKKNMPMASFFPCMAAVNGCFIRGNNSK